MCSTPSEFWCNYSNAREYICEGVNVQLYGNAHIYGTGCSKIPSKFQFQERFKSQKSLITSNLKNTHTCKHSLKDAIYIPVTDTDLWNPYEGLHNHNTAFVAMMIMGLVSNNIIFDKVQGNPNQPNTLLEIWTTTFPHVYDLSETGPICVNRVIIPPSSENSLQTWHQKTCKDQNIARMYRDWVLRSFNIPLISVPYDADIPRVLYTMRKRGLRRFMENEEDMLSTMKKNNNILVQSKVLHRLDVKTQIDLIYNTDILISTHGATLAWLFILKPCAQVIEIFSQPHYVHMAKVYSIQYHSVASNVQWGSKSYNVDINAVVEKIKQARDAWKQCISKYY